MTKITSFFRPYPASIFIIIIACGLMGFTPIIPSELKLVVYLAGVILLAFHGLKADFTYLIFALYLVINIAICHPQSYFRAWERLGLFIPAFFVASSFIKNRYAVAFRKQALKILLVIDVIFSILSFIGYFMDINMMDYLGDELTDYQGNAGWFSGFYIHSMTLGPMSAMAACYIIYLSLVKKKLWLIIFSIPCIGSVMFASSRTAFLAMVFGIIALIYKYANNTKRFLKITAFIIIALAITFPIWNKGLDGMAAKQAVFAEQGKFGTRTDTWADRINEFKTSPILGVGFCTVSDSISDYSSSTGQIEPGSSWLAVLSMTGLIGFGFVLSFFVKAFRSSRKSNDKYSMLLFPLLVLTCIHMMGEGYIFAGGSPLCVIAWLIVGCCNDLGTNQKTHIELK